MSRVPSHVQCACLILLVVSFEDAELTFPGAAEGASGVRRVPQWEQARQRFSRRQMAFISPRLGLLNNLPMAVPFQIRLEAFREFVE